MECLKNPWETQHFCMFFMARTAGDGSWLPKMLEQMTSVFAAKG